MLPTGPTPLTRAPRPIDRLAPLCTKPTQMRLDVEGGYTLVYRTCTATRKDFQVRVKTDALNAYCANAADARTCFPDLSCSAREFLISNTTPAEWDKIFKGVT